MKDVYNTCTWECVFLNTQLHRHHKVIILIYIVFNITLFIVKTGIREDQNQQLLDQASFR